MKVWRTDMRMLRSHGITRDESEFEFTNDGPWYYEQQELGLNYRLTDIAAALGLSQLQRIDSFIQQRNSIAARYNEAFASTQVAVPHIDANCISAFHLYIVRCDFDKFGHHSSSVIPKNEGRWRLAQPSLHPDLSPALLCKDGI